MENCNCDCDNWFKQNLLAHDMRIKISSNNVTFVSCCRKAVKPRTGQLPRLASPHQENTQHEDHLPSLEQEQTLDNL